MKLEEKLKKVDKFYLSLTGILILMAILLILSFRGVFSMFLNAYEYDQNAAGLVEVVQKDKLEEAYEFSFSREGTKLTKIPEVKLPEPTQRP